MDCKFNTDLGVVTVNDDVYGRLTVDDVEDVLKKYQD